MDKNLRLDKVFMNIAIAISNLSYCERTKVGALIVKDGNLISFGYNGTPAGMDNCCERKQYSHTKISYALEEEFENSEYPYTDEIGNYKLVTKREVIHAESNAILKASKSGMSVNGSTLYLTLSPCLECSKLIIQSGIKKLVYLHDYRDLSGVIFLKDFIEVKHFTDDL